MDDIIKVLNMWYSIYEGNDPKDVESSIIRDIFVKDPVKMLNCAVFMWSHQLPASYLKRLLCSSDIYFYIEEMASKFSSLDEETKQKQIFNFTVDAQSGCMLMGKSEEMEKGIILL